MGRQQATTVTPRPRPLRQPQLESRTTFMEHENTLSCLDMVSDSCFERTGATSAGLPGLTVGEQIGGMWKSMAEINRR